MKVRELFEQYDREDPHFLSKQDIDALPAPDAGNIEDRFRVGKVPFYQTSKGMGSTPWNQNIIYDGCVGEMKCSDFLKLASPADREEDAQRFLKFLEKGAAFASPFLEIKWNETEWKESGAPLVLEVKGHEGRGRCLAIIKYVGDIVIPVQLRFRGGVKARDLSERLFKEMRETGIIPQEQKRPLKVKIGKIFWDGKTL